jgi:hypothetical protein
MSIRNMLSEILKEGAERPADKSDGEKASQKIEQDVTKQGKLGSKSGLGHGRIADQSGEQAAHQGTKINDPSGKIEKGRGTEVQGNDNDNDGLGEDDVSTKSTNSVLESLAEAIVEMSSVKVDMSAIKSLCEAQEMTEEFAAQAVEIFEAAVNDVIQQRLLSVSESIDALVSEAVAEEVASLEEQVDAYLDYVVTEWAEENRLAIEQGARTEIAESFMENLKGLLESHYVDLPEGKADLYEAAIEQGEIILSKLEEAEEACVQLLKENEALEKSIVVESLVGGMTALQADKIRTLAESISYNGDMESFKDKLSTLSEGYVKQQKSTTTSLVEDAGQIIEQEGSQVSKPAVDPAVARAVAAITRLR